MSLKWEGGKGRVQVRDLAHKSWWAIVYPTGEWVVYAFVGKDTGYSINAHREIAKGQERDMDAAKEAVARFEKTRK